jgi:hypothetical protein
LEELNDFDSNLTAKQKIVKKTEKTSVGNDFPSIDSINKLDKANEWISGLIAKFLEDDESKSEISTVFESILSTMPFECKDADEWNITKSQQEYVKAKLLENNINLPSFLVY